MLYTRVHRLLKILTLIQSGSDWNVKRLAEACGTSVRNIYRDLNMLEAAGVPYYHDEESGGYRVRRDFFMPPVELTLEESLAVICLAERIGEQEQVPFMDAAATAVRKLLAQLPAPLREQVAEVERHVEIQLAASMPADGVKDVYQLVREAIATKRALRCVYESPRRRQATGEASALPADEPMRGSTRGVTDERLRVSPPGADKRRSNASAGADEHQPATSDTADEPFLFKPYCLFFNQRAWYALGHHGGRQALRCLKLSRFARIEPTETPYGIPDDFSLRGHLGKAWRMIPGDRLYRVELHFDAAFADTVADTHWHDTQEVEWHEDGSITFRCEVAGLDEIVWWVLGMGPHCTVRRPKALADRVHQLASATAALYTAGRSEQKSEKRRAAR